MNKLKFILILLIWNQFSFSQIPYFQQQVDYKINVSLDDKNHILRGFETINYKNNSKDTLRSIYLHIWANAYKNDQNSFVQQEVENGKTDFYFSKQNDRGFTDSLNFKISNETVNVSNYNNHEDILLLELTQPLLPSHSIEITTPFRVVIPYTFSRLGHVAQTYQISQWYPKPAVYDKNGWHTMPYLSQGEFYGEFGSYDVSITLPSNYVVAATGDLQEESEKKFIEQKQTDTLFFKNDSVIKSSSTLKTISFKQNNVHDFAWFADKELYIEKTEVTLLSGKKVNCYSYFKPTSNKLYKGSSKIIANTISYLSEQVGEYPYNHASIIEASLTAGEGMEYPNIAVIGKAYSESMLQTVIIHEVGHNWFYGMLGSNERDFPWMDESINSFYEAKIDKNIENKIGFSKREKTVNTLMDKLNDALGYPLNAKQNLDQAALLPATLYTNSNYGGILYQKAPKLFAYLEDYIGEEIFSKIMKRYFNEWHFKHPYPDDLKKIIQEESGKQLEWFFEDGLGSTKKIDFKMQSVCTQENNAKVKGKSRTNFKGPMPISACIKDSICQTKWVDYPYAESANFTNLPSAITSFVIDKKGILPEIKISNNAYKKYGLFHRFQSAIKLGAGYGISAKNELYIFPICGYNYYDKFMLGTIIHNIKLPSNKFQFALAPMYSLHAKSLVGSGFISYSVFPKNVIQQITFGLQGRSYHYNESHLNISNSLFLRYSKIMPSINIDFKKKAARSAINNSLVFRYYYISEQTFKYNFNVSDSLFTPSVGKAEVTHTASSMFTHKNSRTFNPYSYNIISIGNSNFLKLSLECNLQIDYFKKGKAFYSRFFAGKFFDFKNSSNLFALRDRYLNATNTSQNDFLYNQVYLARNEQKGFLSHQIAMNEGGFKIQSSLLSSPIGQNDNWLAAFNFRTDLPIKLPLKIQLFADIGTFANAKKINSSGNKAIFDGGVELHLFKEILILYLPLVMSKDFKDYLKSNYAKNKLLNSLSFSFNVDKINWFKTQNVLHFFDF